MFVSKSSYQKDYIKVCKNLLERKNFYIFIKFLQNPNFLGIC